MPDAKEDGISAAVRAARERQLLTLLESTAVMMLDPVLHCRIIAAAIILRPLKNVNLLLQNAAPDASTVTTLESVYATLQSMLEDDDCPVLLATARAPLTAALGEQPAALSLTAIVVRNADRGTTDVTMTSVVPAYTRIIAVAASAAVKAKAASAGQPAVMAVAAVKAANVVEREATIWDGVLTMTQNAVAAAVNVYNKRARPVVNYACRRHAAALYKTDKASLDAIDFKELLNDTSSALPFVPDGEVMPRRPWSWIKPVGARADGAAAAPAAGAGAGSAAAAAAVANDADDDSHLDAGLIPALLLQWAEFKRRVAAAAPDDIRTVTAADQRLTARYWIRTRPLWPDLSELMLLWLTTPISTACVERGFSYMTMMDAITRRRRMKEPGFRADFLEHLHHEWLRNALKAAIK